MWKKFGKLDGKVARGGVSAIVLTHNNASTIRACLDSIVPVSDEIVVVDGGSTDATREIAGEYPETRIIEHPFQGISDSRNAGLAQCRFDWILQIDADEVFSGILYAELRHLLSRPVYNAYWFPRYWLASLAPPLYIDNGLTYPDHQLRLFRRPDAARYYNEVHQQIDVIGPHCRLTTPHLMHLHYLLHDREAREQRLRYYDRLQHGSGSGIYRDYYIYEETDYRVMPSRESIDVHVDSRCLRSSTVDTETGDSDLYIGIEESLSVPIKSALSAIQQRSLRRSRYRGVTAIKNPLDFWVYQELVSELRPDFIVEVGTWAGGGTLALADLCEAVNHGSVISVDIDHGKVPALVKQHPRITLIEDSAIGALPEVRRIIGGSRNVLVIEDSSHTYENTLLVLRNYAELVPEGGYFIVEDGICHHGVDMGPRPGAYEAIGAFLEECSDFISDRCREDFLLTFNPRGFLKRVRHRPR